MQKYAILSRLVKSGVIAVVRGNDKAEVIGVVDALVRGGITGIELTFTVPRADKIIAEVAQEYAERPEVVVGAGTVLDTATARIAIMSGAEYIVSPNFNLKIAKIANLYQIPYLPGVETISEITEALQAGVDIVKLFPGSVFGPDYVKAVKAPFPHLNIMPTGGVSIDNMEAWFASGVITVGVGGNLTKLPDNKDYSVVERNARKWKSKLEEIRAKS
ncbi:MAG: bifunctional 2-keto-4-hydroxyglutarate aldolase/2-keto-3-deoxy-6-phosphogluconate aldolase [Candidatus Ancillula trichonymphae]|jgi:2-dehydro-3-deoxyphosphogluconate aldolase/(4S)-4-hydroxy-2-oxoglutarate aldolase|nr:bifunctional 2-keto-4-hydroxyglutarate aldolase/2-keto-3-deoxy-6-phosphogluconate aldolase [Candidatus Ancillula trichonymphae]